MSALLTGSKQVQRRHGAAAVTSVDGDRGRRSPGCAVSARGRREILQPAEPEKFFITPHYDGYPAILVRLSRVDLDEMTELVIESWRICAPTRLLAAYDSEHPPPP